jgi:beta-galactosidase
MRLWSYQAVAHGADTIMFFQLRRSRGACEKFHGAVISHAGHEHTRVFRECAELGKELVELGDALLDSRIHARVALLFDWENWWALEFSSGPTVDLKYLPQIEKYYRACWNQNIPVDLISPAMDMDKYDIVIAPVAYLLQPGYAEKVEEFVSQGGIFLTTFFSGIVDDNDRAVLGGYPGELRKVTGIWAEEIDALFPDMRNAIVISEAFPELAGNHVVGLMCDLIHAETAEVVGTYATDFYAGRPALTRNRFGQGWAWYVASDPEQGFVDRLVRYLCSEKGITPILETPVGIEVTERHKDGQTFTFVLNHNADSIEIDLGTDRFRDLLTGKELTGKVKLGGRDLLILRLQA